MLFRLPVGHVLLWPPGLLEQIPLFQMLIFLNETVKLEVGYSIVSTPCKLCISSYLKWDIIILFNERRFGSQQSQV